MATKEATKVTIGEWANFFSGEYDIWSRENANSEWVHQGSIEIHFTPNGTKLGEYCLEAKFNSVNIPNFTVSQGFFHLKTRGGGHLAAKSHPNNWNNYQGDVVLDGGVMEGKVGSKGNYFRFGFWEADGFAPPGVPLQGKFAGKTYKGKASPLIEWNLFSRWRKPRPDDNYPWNVP